MIAMPRSIDTPSAAHASRRDDGFTLIEVMMALTVLFIGVMGVVAIERSTIASNVDARQVTTASNVARTWLERLQSDSVQWNHPSTYQPTSDIDQTVFLKSYNTGWFLPVPTAATPSWAAAFDINGNDVTTSTQDIVYCANIRLTPVYFDPLCQVGAACPATTPSLLRAEVRVYWSKNRMPLAACGGAVAAGAGSDPIGGNDVDYHWVYIVGAVGKTQAI